MEPLDVVAAVRRACREADGQDPLDEATWLRLQNHGLGADALDTHSEVAFALVSAGSLDLAVVPSARGRGIGADLAEAAMVHGPARAWSHGDHPAAARLAQRHDWQRVRELWVMRRPSSMPLPDVETPPEVTIRGYRPDDADDVLAVNARAFADHPEQGALDEQGLAERMAEDWFDPDGLLLAVDESGRLLGFHWTKQHSPELGEVYVVGIDPAAQGGGLGRLLTLAGLHHLIGKGVQEILLYVESDNAPALAVYQRLGFEHRASDTHVQYAREPIGG